MTGALETITTYGPLGLFCVAFWRYITTVQAEQIETLRGLRHDLDSVLDEVKD